MLPKVLSVTFLFLHSLVHTHTHTNLCIHGICLELSTSQQTAVYRLNDIRKGNDMKTITIFL